MAVNQGGTADKLYYSSLTDNIILSRTFFVAMHPEGAVGGRPVRLKFPLAEVEEIFFILVVSSNL